MFAKLSKFAVLALALMFIAVGCGPKEPVVARVGREKITLKEFKDNFLQRFRSEENAQRRSYEDREKAVREMAIELAKYQEGVALGLDKKPEVAKQMEEVARRKALDMLYKEKVVDVVITDAAAKDFYDKGAEEVKAKHILLRTAMVDSLKGDSVRVKARADSIKRVIQQGSLSFGMAAKLFSDDQSSAADSGNLGWFGWGRMVDEFQSAVWAAHKNEVVGPVRTQFGYHIILLEDRRPVEGRPAFDDSKEAIKAQLREVLGQKMMDVARKYVEDLRTKYKIAYDENNMDVFRKRVLDPSVSKTSGTLDPVFTEEQKKLVTATYKGGSVTIKDMLDKVGANAGRVDWNDKQAVKDLVNAIAEPKILEADAEGLGYYRKAQKDPEVMAERRRGVIGLLEKQEVTDKINPTEAQDRQYYESHLASFIQPELRTVREIFIKTDSTKAAKIRARALKGENFTKLAIKLNEKESTQPDTGRLGPFDEKRFGLLGKTAFSLAKVGDVSNVVAVGKNFSVLQLIDIVPSRTKTFEEAQAEVKRLNRQELTDQATKDLEERSLKKYPLKLDAKVLASAWPVPAESNTPGKPDKLTREP